MTRYIEFILKYRFFVLALVLGITVLAMVVASGATMSTQLGEDMIGNRPEFHRYIERANKFYSDAVVVVGIEDPDMLSRASQHRLRAAVAGLEAHPDVETVQSILDAASMDGDGEALKLTDYAELALADQTDHHAVKKQLLDDSLVGPLFISADGRAHAVMVELTVDESRTGERAPPLVDEILAVFVDAGYDANNVHRAGFTAAMAESVRQLQFNTTTIFPIVTLLLLIVVWLMFRRLWPAAVALTVSLLSVIWTVGFIVAKDGTVTALVSLTPPVVLVVAFSDVVHLCSAYLTCLGRGMAKDKAIRSAGTEVGKACLLTSATTFAGFASFGLVPQPAMQTVALALAIGVAVALLLALTLAPILFSLLREPKPLRQGATGFVHTAMDRVLGGAQRLATGRPRTVVAAFLVVAVLAVAGAPGFTFDADFERRFDEDNSLTIDSNWFKEHFVGTNTLDVYVTAPQEEGLLEPERLRAVAALQDDLVALPGVDSATSLVDLLKEIHRAMAPERAARDPLPDSRALIAQYLLLFESSGGEELDRIVDFERQEMVIGLRLNNFGARATARTGIKVQEMLPRHLGDLAEGEASGLVFLLGYFFDDIINGQKMGFGLSFILIALLMALGLRSFRVGLMSMIPNLLPVLVLAGWMGGCFEHVDSDVVLVMVMAIGIGVDDTIHFLMRYRVEIDRGATPEDAISGTFAFAGRGILMTTVILVVGFLPCAFSGYITMQYLGILLPTALIVALLADVLLVPAMITLGWMRLR